MKHLLITGTNNEKCHRIGMILTTNLSMPIEHFEMSNKKIGRDKALDQLTKKISGFPEATIVTGSYLMCFEEVIKRHVCLLFFKKSSPDLKQAEALRNIDNVIVINDGINNNILAGIVNVLSRRTFVPLPDNQIIYV